MMRHLARGAGIAAKDVRIARGNPVDKLIEAVATEDADILVMGTIVRGPVRQVLIGSTTEQLMHVAPCDMLLVKSKQLPAGLRPRLAEMTAGRCNDDEQEVDGGGK